MNNLIDKKLKDKKYGQQPDPQVELPVRIIDDPCQNAVAYIIKAGGEVLHIALRREQMKYILNGYKTNIVELWIVYLRTSKIETE